MKLETILEAAAKGYDVDGFPPDGDTLATFVQNEIRETYDPDATDEEHVKEAVRVIQNATGQLAKTWVAISQLAN